MPANNENRVQSNLQFQPLLSIKMTDDLSLITRPVLQIFNRTPFQDQTGQDKRVTAFGDTVLALALSPGPKLVGNWLLAAGPTFIFPTATDSLIGQNKWQVGPAAAVGYKGKNFITYVFPQQWFSVGGDGQKANHMLLYYAFVWVYSNGWSVGTNPSMSVDWEASSGNKVAFPVGLQVGKLRKLGPLAGEVRRAGPVLRRASTSQWPEMESSAPNNPDSSCIDRAQVMATKHLRAMIGFDIERIGQPRLNNAGCSVTGSVSTFNF